jgi:hypothetical protein
MLPWPLKVIDMLPWPPTALLLLLLRDRQPCCCYRFLCYIRCGTRLQICCDSCLRTCKKSVGEHNKAIITRVKLNTDQIPVFACTLQWPSAAQSHHNPCQPRHWSLSMRLLHSIPTPSDTPVQNTSTFRSIGDEGVSTCTVFPKKLTQQIKKTAAIALLPRPPTALLLLPQLTVRPSAQSQRRSCQPWHWSHSMLLLHSIPTPSGTPVQNTPTFKSIGDEGVSTCTVFPKKLTQQIKKTAAIALLPRPPTALLLLPQLTVRPSAQSHHRSCQPRPW